MQTHSQYVLHDSVTDVTRTELAEYPPIVQQLLANRKITSRGAAQRFLNPSYDTDLHDPFLLPDIEVAVARIIKAIAEEESIVIYSDYDCDGIPGGVLLHDFFKAIGYSNFKNYIPHRHNEGYGLNKTAIKKLADGGAKLLVTVDCGITDTEEVAYAKELGVDVIVTDHHEPGETLPEAIAVVNPKIKNKDTEAYPFDGLCGTGVAFKLVLALIDRGHFNLIPGKEKWLLDLVGIATIADMVPLTDENRTLAHFGLTVLRKSQRPGLQHLLRKAKAKQQYLTEDDVGFTIGPRVNAASRMDTPEDAFHMLASVDEAIAGAHVEHIEKLNTERRTTVATISKELKRRARALTEVPPVIVLGDPSWRPALVGLAANAIVEEYKRPAFIWGRDGTGAIKGSCRSDGVVSVYEIMRRAEHAFIEFGGHHAAGGFAVSEEGIHTLADALIEAHKSVLIEGSESDPIKIDADVLLSDISDSFVRDINKLAPFGIGNEKPLFRFKDAVPAAVEVFGKAKDHTKIKFETPYRILEAISFYKTPEQFNPTPQVGESCTLIGHIEESFFMGRKQLRIRIVDILPA